jgi:Uma2 family endonuclease
MGTIQVERQRFTVDDYHKMAEVGILSPDDRVELIDGEVLQMSPVGSRHVACVARLNKLLQGSVGDRGIVIVQSPIRLNARYEPEPDVTVLRPREDYYESRLPVPGDVLLAIEVSDATLPFDQTMKAPAYGRSGVPELWIVDLEGERIECHSHPGEMGYRQRILAMRGDTIVSSADPLISIDVRSVFGPL